jgi:hypothetical protein
LEILGIGLFASVDPIDDNFVGGMGIGVAAVAGAEHEGFEVIDAAEPPGGGGKLLDGEDGFRRFGRPARVAKRTKSRI